MKTTAQGTKRNSDRHSRTIRYGKYNLVCPYYNRKTEGSRSFLFRGVKLWNTIPLDMPKKETIGYLKSAFKKQLSFLVYSVHYVLNSDMQSMYIFVTSTYFTIFNF